MNILFAGYRDWSLQILDNLRSAYAYPFREDTKDWKFTLVSTPERLKKAVEEQTFYVVLVYGWSWIVEKEIVDKNYCVCLHPSPLPKYKGGSPLQHQIMNGEKKSAVTLFHMGKGIDDGPILAREELSLKGNLSEILARLTRIGSTLTIKLLEEMVDGTLTEVEQDHSKATTYKRRKPEQSEITLDDLDELSAEEIHNKVRALQDPYPNVFIRCIDGKKLYIKETSLDH